MPNNGMTIDSLNAVTSITAQDKVPVWDNEASGEPTQKITGQNLASSVKSLASLLGTSDVVNNLTSTATDKPLSAAQGKALNDSMTGVYLATATWADVYNKISFLPTGKSTTFFSLDDATQLISDSKLSGTYKGVVANGGSGRYEFIGSVGAGGVIGTIRVNNLTSASATPTVAYVYKYTGTAQ